MEPIVLLYTGLFLPFFFFRPPSLENGFVCLKMAQESCLSGVNWSSFTIENRGNTTVRQWRYLKEKNVMDRRCSVEQVVFVTMEASGI